MNADVINVTIDRSAHTVLVVDDNPATRYSTGRVIRAAGFRTAEAGTGADALPSLSANRGTEPRKLTALLRSELDWVVMKALEKDRDRRYATAAEYADDLDRYAAGRPVLARRPWAWDRAKKWAGRHPAAVAAVLVSLVVVVAASGIATAVVSAGHAETRKAFDDPAFHRMLDAYGGLAAQIVTPIFAGGRLAAIVSVHVLRRPRNWRAALTTTCR